MKKTILLCTLLLAIISCKDTTKETAQAAPVSLDATYYLIRHADKMRGPDAGSDPELNDAGKQRAQFWAEELSDVDFDAVYSTDYKRTLATAQPTAEAQAVNVKLYDPTHLYDAEFQQETAGKTVLVVGHSNTTPAFVNAILGENKYDEIDDALYGFLYVVTVKNGSAQVELKDFNDWSAE
tara:strand:+ start:36 stop:578 length:543 start_codon:yes stop_codon:yes gene_type:complete